MAGLDYRSWWEESSISMRDRDRDIRIQGTSFSDFSFRQFELPDQHLNFNCWNSDSDVNSGNQYFSVQHPNTKMVVFAGDSNGLRGGEFSCTKSLLAEEAMKRLNRQPSSALPNAYQRKWIGAEEGMKWFGAPDSVRFVLDSGICLLPTGIPLNQHCILNDLTDESSEPRPNSAPAINPLHETARTPVAHKRTDEDSEHHSNPNPCVAERGIFEKTNRSDTWYIATGAAHHATGNRHLFTILEVENSDLCVHVADGTPLPVCGRGNVVTDTVLLSDVWYVPGLDVNLVSVGQLAELDYSIGFARGSCTISSAADTVVGRAHAREDGLYEVDFLQVPLGIP